MKEAGPKQATPGVTFTNPIQGTPRPTVRATGKPQSILVHRPVRRPGRKDIIERRLKKDEDDYRQALETAMTQVGSTSSGMSENKTGTTSQRRNVDIGSAK